MMRSPLPHVRNRRTLYLEGSGPARPARDGSALEDARPGSAAQRAARRIGGDERLRLQRDEQQLPALLGPCRGQKLPPQPRRLREGAAYEAGAGGQRRQIRQRKPLQSADLARRQAEEQPRRVCVSPAEIPGGQQRRELQRLRRAVGLGLAAAGGSAGRRAPCRDPG